MVKIRSEEKYVCACSVAQSVRLFVTPWTVAQQGPLSMGFSRQEYWSGLPWPPPGDLPNPGIKPKCLALQADSLLSEPPGKHLEEKWQRTKYMRDENARQLIINHTWKVREKKSQHWQLLQLYWQHEDSSHCWLFLLPVWVCDCGREWY